MLNLSSRDEIEALVKAGAFGQTQFTVIGVTVQCKQCGGIQTERDVRIEHGLILVTQHIECGKCKARGAPRS